MEQPQIAVAVRDAGERAAIAGQLRLSRCTVLEAASGAALFEQLEPGGAGCAAVVLGPSLPDLDAADCAAELATLYPGMWIVDAHGAALGGAPLRGAVRTALLHALASWQPKPPVAESQPPAPAATVSPMSPPPHAIEPYAGQLPGAATLPELIGHSPAMRELCRRIHLVARRRTPVLIYGPTGTGKELVARALHRLSGRGESRGRHGAGRFLAINCAAIPEALLEAELFGHVRGAFTGAVTARTGRMEAADGGTLFLDEIGELPLAVQAKLLRFLECGEVQRVGDSETIRVDVRVIAATHRRLGAMANEGAFRLDLLHRLAVFLLETPPLAGRPEDLDALIDHRMAMLAAEHAGVTVRPLTPGARRRMHAHGWPGNVRELEHTLERAWILSEGCAVIDEGAIDFGSVLG